LDYDLVKGIPTRYYTSGIQDLNLNFDANTGNLLSRNDAIKGLTENFTYDNLNRLTGSSVNSVQQFSMTYDDNSGNSLGNIKTKSDIGNYSYDANKINAVRFITTNSGTPTNPPNVISTNTQTISYTPFLKAATIDENRYQLTYSYGQDEQRIKSVLKQNGSILETKYYLGSYEKQVKSGITREIHYVSAGNGLCAIIVVQGGVATPYFVYSDHLGSPLTLTNSTGTVIAEQNFDAWGRYRNPSNWTYNNVPARPDWLYRGFTGHEHLSQFALINMNGRMYDPVTCRILSPDNYVQQPFNTQNYNRYSYVLNNPLKYSDPSGQFIVVDSWLTGFFSGLFRGGLKEGWKEANNRAANDARLWAGLFTTNSNKNVFGRAWELVSRFTWQLPQEAFGFGISQFENSLVGNVQNVNYFDGATVIRRTNTNGRAFTLGNFLIGSDDIRDDPNNGELQHEYGHYLQSQSFGFAYLPFDAVPNLLHTWTNPNDYMRWPFDPTERDGNARSLLYFSKYHKNVDWDFDNIVSGTDRTLSINDPVNQAAAKNNLRHPGFFDIVSGILPFSNLWLLDALYNTLKTNTY
jgi:RHS repeat-associated protein